MDVSMYIRLGMAYLLIAHDLALVHHISDRIAVMYLGHIVEQGPSHRVFDAPAHPYTQALLDAVPLLDPQAQRRRRAARRAAPPLDSARVAPSGCPYRNRCPQAMPRCAESVPPAYPAAGGGTVNCFLYADTAKLPRFQEIKQMVRDIIFNRVQA